MTESEQKLSRLEQFVRAAYATHPEWPPTRQYFNPIRPGIGCCGMGAVMAHESIVAGRRVRAEELRNMLGISVTEYVSFIAGFDANPFEESLSPRFYALGLCLSREYVDIPKPPQA